MVEFCIKESIRVWKKNNANELERNNVIVKQQSGLHFARPKNHQIKTSSTENDR